MNQCPLATRQLSVVFLLPIKTMWLAGQARCVRQPFCLGLTAGRVPFLALYRFGLFLTLKEDLQRDDQVSLLPN